MELKFRPASAAETISVEQLIKSAQIPQARQLGLEIMNADTHWLDHAIEGGRVYVGFVDGEMVGAAVTTLKDGNNLFIDHMAVLPGKQGRGIGGWMLSCVEATARSRECAKISFKTAVMMSELLHLGSRFGFQESSRTLTQDSGNPHAQVYMEKIL
jgi:GNAT superfamily N-acetyltransferase